MSAPAGIDPETGEVLTLSDDEAARLGELEQIIHDRINAFVEVGQALLEIQSCRLYREEYSTFEEYCKQAWDITRSYGYRLIAAAEVVNEMSPIGDAPLPTSEAQARELKAVEGAEAKADVMREASQDGPATAAKIKDVVTKRTETPAKGREVRTETVETEPPPAPPKRSLREQNVANAADRQAQNFCQYRPEQIDERTVVRLEAWCQKWRNEQAI